MLTLQEHFLANDQLTLIRESASSIHVFGYPVQKMEIHS